MKSWSSRLEITPALRNEWHWWLDILPSWKGSDPARKLRTPDLVLTTDASEWGWGAWLANQQDQSLTLTDSTFGRFPEHVAIQSSNFREMTAIGIGLIET